MLTNRKSLWWLLGPPVVYLAALPLVNQVEPVVLGLPFMMFWMLLATLLSPLFVWLAAKGDPVWAAAQRAERERAGEERG
jgi:hypothetical protein